MAKPELGRTELLELLGMLDEVIVVVGRDRKIHFVSRMEEGYEPEDVIGQDVLGFIAPEAREEQAALLDRAFETGEHHVYEFPMFDAQGERQWQEGRAIPTKKGGRVEFVVTLTRNVSDRHRAQEEAKRLRRLLPVCSWCRRIRDDEGRWHDLEAYIAKDDGPTVTHGLCPRCEEGMVDGSTRSQD